MNKMDFNLINQLVPVKNNKHSILYSITGSVVFRNLSHTFTQLIIVGKKRSRIGLQRATATKTKTGIN